MKTLASASFFRVFDLLLGTSNPGLRLDAWEIGDVRFEHERHITTAVRTASPSRCSLADALTAAAAGS